jgi:hypothetical protein
VFSNIAQCRSTKQRITDSVQQHIAVGVGNATLCMGYLYPTQHKSKTLAQGVNIVSVTNSEVHTI